MGRKLTLAKDCSRSEADIKVALFEVGTGMFSIIETFSICR